MVLQALAARGTLEDGTWWAESIWGSLNFNARSGFEKGYELLQWSSDPDVASVIIGDSASTGAGARSGLVALDPTNTMKVRLIAPVHRRHFARTQARSMLRRELVRAW